MRRCKIIGLVMWLLLVLPAAVGQAQNGYPPPQEAYINDYAGLLTPADAANSRALLTNLKEEHGVEATVVTIETLAAYDTGDQTIEAFATGLFNTWGIGDPTRNDGVLLLVAVAERKVRIEVGTGYESSKNEAMQEVINEHILPTFRQEDMSRGIYLGVRAIVGHLTGEWPPELGSTVTPSSGLFRSAYALLANLHPGYYVGGGVLVALGLYQLRRRRRSRRPKKRCPECQATMKIVDETASHQYLDEGQRLEQELDSMRYTVWLCPKCHHHTLESHPKSYLIERCPKCNYRTVKVVSRTEVQPTYIKKGRQRVRKRCQLCPYTSNKRRSIPLKKRTAPPKRSRRRYGSSTSSIDYSSSSSSHSDFGGGSSSGDGASGDF